MRRNERYRVHNIDDFHINVMDYIEYGMGFTHSAYGHAPGI
jgi:hypothetical protein